MTEGHKALESHNNFAVISDERFTALCAEVARALEKGIPDADERQEAVDWLFQSDSRAPFSLAMECLTGSLLDDIPAASAWRNALVIQHTWSRRLNEPVTMQAAATEALSRSVLSDAAPAQSPSSALRDCLERDLITGWRLRAPFEKLIAAAIAGCQETGQPAALVLAQFEYPPSTSPGLRRGQHLQAGGGEDEVRTIGEAARQHFRPADVLCRWDEKTLAVLLPATTTLMAQSLAEEFVEALQLDRSSAPISVAIGVACYPNHADAVPALVCEATAALRRALRGGSGRVVVSDARMRIRREDFARPEPPFGMRFPTGLALGAAFGLVISAGIGLVRFGHWSDHRSVSLPSAAAHPVTMSAPAALPEPAPMSAPSPQVASLHEAKVEPAPLGSAFRLQDLVEAAVPRTKGDYPRAARQLCDLGLGSRSLEEKVAALTASACAQAAAGISPLERLDVAGSLASSVDTADRSQLQAEVDLARGRWFARRSRVEAARAIFETILIHCDDSDIREETALELVALAEKNGRSYDASHLCSAMAAVASHPDRTAAFQLLAADAEGRSSDAIRVFLKHPGMPAGPDIFRRMVSAALGRAILGSGADRGNWRDRLHWMVSCRTSPAIALSIRLAAVVGALDRKDPVTAYDLLDPALAQASQSQDVGAADRVVEVRVLRGIAQRQLGHLKESRADWAAALDATKVNGADRGAPLVWTPAPDEQRWTELASYLMGRTSAAAHRRFVELAG